MRVCAQPGTTNKSSPTLIKDHSCRVILAVLVCAVAAVAAVVVVAAMAAVIVIVAAAAPSRNRLRVLAPNAQGPC